MSDAPVTRDARPRHQDGLHIAAPHRKSTDDGGGATLAIDCLPIQAPDPAACLLRRGFPTRLAAACCGLRFNVKMVPEASARSSPGEAPEKLRVGGWSWY
jgi:hypothetical protein